MNLLQRDELQEWEWEWDAEGQNTEELQQRFEITGLESLNWVFRKLGAIQAEEMEIKALADKERERIDIWEQEQKKTLQQSASFFESLIQIYHAKQLAADPKAKTLSTPYGDSKAVASKAQPDKANESVLLQYAKENKMQECIKESLKWAELKKTLKVVSVGGQEVVVDDAGQIVPGAVVKSASINYSVKLKP